jgi:hypothetical protein
MRYVADVLIGLLSACLALVTVAVWNRNRFGRDPGAFVCRAARLTRRGWQRDGLRWGWLRTRAKWVNDVLVVQCGLLWMRSVTIAVALPKGVQIEAEPPSTVRRLGARPQSLWIDSGDTLPLKIAVREQDRSKLAGPFVAAAMDGLPTPPRRNRRPAA